MEYIVKRMCIACRERKEKKCLLRIVKQNGNYELAHSYNRQFGRSMYICKNSSCIEKVIKKKLLNKILKAQISEDIYTKIGEFATNE